MFIIASLIFLVVGIGRGSIFYYQMYKRPRVEAEIQKIEMKTGFPPFKKREKAFARVKYQFNEHSFDNEEMVLKTKAQVMDRITCYVDPKNPKDIEQFAPKKDSLQVIAVLSIGIVLMMIHFAMMNWLDQ